MELANDYDPTDGSRGGASLEKKKKIQKDKNMVDLGFESEGEEYNAADDDGKAEPEVDLLDQKLFGGQALEKDNEDLEKGPDGAIDVETTEAASKNEVKVKRKRVKLKLDEERLCNGIEGLAPYFCQTITEETASNATDGAEEGDPSMDGPMKKKIKKFNTNAVKGKDFPSTQVYRGPGHEASDLKKLINNYRNWAKKVAPFMSFEDVVDKCEKLGSKLVVRDTVESMRYWTGHYVKHDAQRLRLLKQIEEAETLDLEVDARQELQNFDNDWENFTNSRTDYSSTDFTTSRTAKKNANDPDDISSFIVPNNSIEYENGHDPDNFDANNKISDSSNSIDKNKGNETAAKTTDVTYSKEELQKRIERNRLAAEKRRKERLEREEAERNKNKTGNFIDAEDDDLFANIDLSGVGGESASAVTAESSTKAQIDENKNLSSTQTQILTNTQQDMDEVNYSSSASLKANEERPSTAEDGEGAKMQTQVQEDEDEDEDVDMVLESTQVLENTQDQDMDFVPSVESQTQLLESQASLDDHQQPLFTNDVSAGTQSNDSTQLLQTQEVLNSQDNAESET